MTQYLLSVYQPEGPMPEPDVLAGIFDRLEALRAEMREAGAWVFSGGLAAPSTATVIRNASPDGGDALLTDGPFIESKEYFAGLTIIEAPDLDAALAWGRKAAAATTLPIEVRPFVG